MYRKAGFRFVGHALILTGFLLVQPVSITSSFNPTIAVASGIVDEDMSNNSVRRFTVNSTTDAVDATPGDGTCATAAGDCTLRAAIQETNALPGADVIFVPSGVYALTIPGVGEDSAAKGDLDITDSLQIYGTAPKATIVDGGGLDRVFQIPKSVSVTIRSMTIRNGNAAAAGDSGGGIFNGEATQTPHGFLKLVDVTVTGNSAVFGGGIMNGWGASTVLQRATVSNNTASYGAGLYTRDSGTVSANNSTFSGNTASGGGGGIDTWSNAQVALSYVTITQNSAAIGAGINRERNTRWVTLTGTILANNSGGDCAGLLISKGYNLDGDKSCSLKQPTDLPGRDPVLGLLANNGGATETHALLHGSPAVDSGGTVATGCPLTDQRGMQRPDEVLDGGACDIGSYESQGGQ